MKLALSNPTGEVFELTDELRSEGLLASRESPRKRIILPIHRVQGALVQRMVNFLQPGTYVRPHLHPRECASETLVIIGGELGFLIFDEDGGVVSTHRLGPGEFIDIEPGVWHGCVVLRPDTYLVEAKLGPYSDRDKVFADWAPEEGDESADVFVRSLEDRFSS